MTVIDLGVVTRDRGGVATENYPQLDPHRWRGGVHRRRVDPNARLLTKLSGLLVLGVVAVLTGVGTATRTLETLETLALGGALALLGYLVVRP